MSEIPIFRLLSRRMPLKIIVLAQVSVHREYADRVSNRRFTRRVARSATW